MVRKKSEGENKMKEQKQVEAMAELDGYKPCRTPTQRKSDPEPRGWSKTGGGWNSISRLPDYLNSHDACHRVIDTLSDDVVWEILKELAEILKPIHDNALGMAMCFKAKPAQEVEAILKATGKWEAD